MTVCINHKDFFKINCHYYDYDYDYKNENENENENEK